AKPRDHQTAAAAVQDQQDPKEPELPAPVSPRKTALRKARPPVSPARAELDAPARRDLAAPYAPLHRLLDEVRDDPRRFDAAYDAIREAAERSALAENVRARVFAALDAARIAGDAGGPAQALLVLETSP